MTEVITKERNVNEKIDGAVAEFFSSNANSLESEVYNAFKKEAEAEYSSKLSSLFFTIIKDSELPRSYKIQRWVVQGLSFIVALISLIFLTSIFKPGELNDWLTYVMLLIGSSLVSDGLRIIVMWPVKKYHKWRMKNERAAELNKSFVNNYVDAKMVQFTSDIKFFYEFVVKLLSDKELELNADLIDTEGKMKKSFVFPRIELEAELAQAENDLEMFRKNGIGSGTIQVELQESIAILKQQLRNPSPEEQALLDQKLLAQQKILRLNDLIKDINEKKSFYDDNAASLDRANRLIQKAKPTEYQSANQLAANPMFAEIQGELAEINDRLDIALAQTQQVKEVPMLMGAENPIDRLLAAKSAVN